MRTTLLFQPRVAARIFTLLCCGLVTSVSASAANLTWTAAVNGNWDTTTMNWFNGSIPTRFNTGDNVNFNDSAASLNVTINSSVAPASTVFNDNASYTISGSGGITGNGGLTKIGTGTLSFSTLNAYTGPTFITVGTLALSGNGSIGNSSAIAISSGATLDASGRGDGTLTLSNGQTLAGVGSVHGTVTVTLGTVLAPGTAAVGTLTLNSNLNLAGSVIVKLNGSTLQNDLVTGINHLGYGGTLIVNNLGSSLAAGESFTLFNFSSFTGNFTNLVGSPGAGLAYVFNPVTGVLSITNMASTSSAANAWVNTVNGSTLVVHFDGLVQPSSATNTDNYTVYSKSFSSSNPNITNAVLQSDLQTVALYLDAPAGEFFAVAVTNVLDSASNSISATTTGFTGFTATTSIGTNGDPVSAGEAIPIFGDTFTVAAGGSDIGGTDDHCQFVYQPVVGNFEMAAQVTRLDITSLNAKAGLMAREDTASGSRSLGIYFTPPVSLGATPTNQILTLYRSGTNGSANALTSPIGTSSLNWLRMTRTNNVFSVYYGTNGVTWNFVGSISQAWNGTTLVGLATTSNTNGLNTTAGFGSYGVSGGRPGDGIVPKITASIFQKTNLMINWQRTPRDFAVQIATNLVQDTNSSGGTNAWGFVMLPVFDTSLTGTNTSTPPSGRYMTIPMNLSSGGPMFVRLTQVERVIPDPIVVTAGYVFSLASSNLVKNAATGSILCNDSVDTTSLVTQNSTLVICPPGHTYQFTTVNSGSSLHTALQTRNLKTLLPTCDGNYTAGNFKAQITFTNVLGSGATNFTFVAGAGPSPAATVTTPVVVTVNILP